MVRGFDGSSSINGTILLVDDQPESIDVVKSALDQYYTIKVATNGPLALKIAAQGGVDLMLLDVVMPGMDGYEVCRHLKENPATKEIPVIFLTAKDSPKDEAIGLQLGAVDFIRKPSHPSVILARSSNTIDFHRTKETLRQKNSELQQAMKIREDMERLSHHDLKGPLTGIIGIPQFMLKSDNLSNEHRKLLRMIEKSGYNLLAMINRSLDLFKMENETYRLQASTFDLMILLGKVVTDLGSQARSNRITVSFEGVGSSPDRQIFPIVGETMLCYPIFYNLILNAIEASPKGGHVSIDLKAKGTMSQISITNSGEVFPAIRSRFFEKYVTFGKNRGTGLGTYSAWLATRTQNGTIELQTHIPGQTTVIVCLPNGDPDGFDPVIP
ncbi:MAG: response regulator [Magnetococcales bacterium]|nr:response regulator [Magnetococcales bacterium]